MLSADRRLGAEGAFRIGMNEVAIGMTLPHFAIEIARHRLTPAHFQLIVTGDMHAPAEAVAAGYLDEVVPVDELAARSREVALGLASIDFGAHRGTKLRVRAACLDALRAAIESELPA